MTDSIIEVFTANITRQEQIERCRCFYSYLPQEDREKADRFLREDDRLRFITGRCMIITLAKERLGISAPEIRLSKNGKPYLAGAD